VFAHAVFNLLIIVPQDKQPLLLDIIWWDSPSDIRAAITIKDIKEIPFIMPFCRLSALGWRMH
jgi:hypothetical protein